MENQVPIETKKKKLWLILAFLAAIFLILGIRCAFSCRMRASLIADTASDSGQTTTTQSQTATKNGETIDPASQIQELPKVVEQATGKGTATSNPIALKREPILQKQETSVTTGEAIANIPPKENIPNSNFNIEMVNVTGASFNFAIGKYDITQEQWIAVMGGSHPGFKNCDSCPVVYVSWLDIQEFLKKLNNLTGKHYRLPTEAEWEFAAKGGSKGHYYHFAGSNDVKEVAWYEANSSGRAHPVGRKKPNELGIYDMSGNVWQYCSPRIDTTISNRALRGGAWFIKPVYSRVDYRNREVGDLTDRNDAVGFRVAYSLSTSLTQ